MSYGLFMSIHCFPHIGISALRLFDLFPSAAVGKSGCLRKLKIKSIVAMV